MKEVSTISKRVALLAEGVDRNFAAMLLTSLVDVALLAEGVDRNLEAAADVPVVVRRPPRGGRG